MTSILDNRSSSLPTRQSFAKGLFNQLSSHFSRQETELDNVSYRSSASGKFKKYFHKDTQKYRLLHTVI
jgi:hypothetical protein